MVFRTGELVMYSASGICCCEGIEEKSFDGRTYHRYIVLKPEYEGKSVYYVPEEMAEKKIRRLKTKDEIHSLMDSAAQITPCNYGGKNEQRTVFANVLKSGSPESLLSLLKAIYSRRTEKEAGGKKLSTAEEDAMHSAEKLLGEELCAVFEIDKARAENIILKSCAEA